MRNPLSSHLVPSSWESSEKTNGKKAMDIMSNLLSCCWNCWWERLLGAAPPPVEHSSPVLSMQSVLTMDGFVGCR